jgi:FlaA1/EpsC-like NDP-sugar epimerase
MTIPEACQLVLQAGSMGTGGEIFILDMGEPVRIVDLARDLIDLSGFRVGEDIEIEYTGVRPGEKLFEELSTDSENADKTRHSKIFVGRVAESRPGDVEAHLARLEQAVAEGIPEAAVPALMAMVPEYEPTSASQDEGHDASAKPASVSGKGDDPVRETTAAPRDLRPAPG